MNEEMFFYPPYPFDEIEDMFVDNNYRGNSNLFSPQETLEKGNVLKNQYVGYKNYQPYKIKITNKYSLVNLLALQNYVHDLKLYLDIYPNDTNILNEYNEAKKEYEDVKKNVDLSKLKCPMEGLGEIKLDSPMQHLYRGEYDV